MSDTAAADMHPFLRYSMTTTLFALLCITIFFQTTVHGQTKIDNFGIFPCPNSTENDGFTCGTEGELNKADLNPLTTDDECTCVPFFLCNDDNTLNTDGTGIIDIRFGGQCADFYHKCCRTVKKNDQVIRSNEEDHRVKCGQWNSKGAVFRIIGNVNSEAQFGEFPWMVAIFQLNPLPDHKYTCGGSLIHPKVVLTALHCIHDKDSNDFFVRAGEWDTKSEFEQFPHQDRSILEVIGHKNYYGGAVFNDVALIVLIEKFTLMENVGTICLPPQGYQFYSEKCYVSGWGKTSFSEDNDNHHNILKKIDVSVVPQSTCQNQLRHTRLGQNFKLHDSFMCAGGEIGKDACKGDGGSPLACPVTPNSEQFHLAGMVSWGIGCGDRTPGVYVNVALFRDWIDQHMDELQLDKNYYNTDYVVSNTQSKSLAVF